MFRGASVQSKEEAANSGSEISQVVAGVLKVADFLPHGLAVADLKRRVLVYNQAARKMLGEPPKISGEFFEYFREDERTPLPLDQLPLSKALKGEVFSRYRIVVKPPGFQKGVHIACSGGPILNARSEIIGGIHIFIDLAPILEAERKAAEQHEILSYTSRMSAVGELAGAIAHEINTPIATISLLMETLKDQLAVLPVTVPSIMQDQLGMVERLTSRVRSIIQSLRSLCRVGTSDPFVTETVRKLIEDTQELCVEGLKNAGIDFAIKVDIEDTVTLECQPVQIVQVLLNLISNAKFAIASLDKRWIELRVSREDKFIELRVTDSGTCIPDEIASNLFKPFFTTKPQGQGSGIGLNISKKIIEIHQGQIFLNRGSDHTQFVIRIPLKQERVGAGH